MPRLKQKNITPAQRTERRALQAARALLEDRLTLANEVRVARHVESLPAPDREPWLSRALQGAHPSTAAVLAMCAEMDMDEPVSDTETLGVEPEVAP